MSYSKSFLPPFF